MTRDQILDKILSQYVAIKTKKWWRHQTDKFENSCRLDIDIDDIIACIAQGSSWDFLIKNLNINWDLELTYESLKFDEQDDYAKTLMPSNIEEIRKKISEIYRSVDIKHI